VLQGLIRQQQQLPLQAVMTDLQRPGVESQTDLGLQAPEQQQGGAVKQNPASGVGVCDAVHQIRGAKEVAAAIPLDL